MLLTLLGVVGAVVVLLFALQKKQRRLALRVGLGMVAWGVIYVGLLLAVSLTSPAHMLGLHQRKAFCGAYLDCHVGVSVENVEQVAQVAGQGSERGVFYLVTVRVSSDARQATLSLDHTEATVTDAAGRTYERAVAVENALEGQRGTPVLFEGRVAAGEGYAKILIFDMPADAPEPRLLVTALAPLERFVEFFLIGDEDSFLHKKTYFQL